MLLYSEKSWQKTKFDEHLVDDATIKLNFVNINIFY